MISRRSLFRRLAALAAVVALAPEIAFARRFEIKPHQETLFDKDTTYTCVMLKSTPETTLHSTTWGAEYPEGCLVIENFSEA